MKINLDLKTLITIVAFAATMGGFYYSTQERLTNLENEISTLDKKIKRLNRLIKGK